MKVVCAFAVLLSCADIVLANQLRHRHLQTYYNVVADLGSEDKQVTRANPLKGLLSSIESQFDEAFFPSSLEFYAFKLDSIMIGEDEYDWSELDASLEAAQARHRHVVWRVIDNEQVNYNDSNFLSSIRAFIYTMGTRYDGQKSVGFIQLGLLGRSGQWREEDITSSTKDSVVSWYAEAFPETQLQVPVALPLAANVGMGMHYDSFGDKTIGVESSAGYEEREGLVVIEAESPTNGVVGPWKLESDVSGYTGAGYIRMDGNTVQGGSVNGILNYPFRINTPGNYRISLRTNKNNPDDTWSNDCYVKLLDSAGHAVEPTHDWTKTYMFGPPNVWSTATRLEHHQLGHMIPTFDLQYGDYTIQIGGRSKNFFIDRITIFDQSRVDDGYAEDTARTETKSISYSEEGFWQDVSQVGLTKFWESGAMGGQTEPTIQERIFQPNYDGKETMNQCIDVTRASYIVHQDIFEQAGHAPGEVDAAYEAHTNMGYGFFVRDVAASSASDATVKVDVTLQQVGVAKFYYPLSLVLECPSSTQDTPGVDSLQPGQEAVYSFIIPSSSDCLNDLKLKFSSDRLYNERPIKFAQNDGTVVFSIEETTAPPPAPCSYLEFQQECASTGECVSMYGHTATDCDINGVEGGGVCYCGTTVCGCKETNSPPNPPSPPPPVPSPETPVVPPTSVPVVPPTPAPTEPLPPTNPINATCFSGATIVEVKGKGHISMEELRIGDYVRAGSELFSQVHGFYHLERDAEATYLEITTDKNEYPLDISENHMIFVDNEAVPARDVKLGDKLDDSVVTAIKSVRRKGIYAPATFSGTIVVNDILASTYTSQLAHAPLGEQFCIHLALTYHRLICRADFGLCGNETYSEFGLSNWNLPLIMLTRRLNEYGPNIQIASVFLTLPTLLFLYLIELMVVFPLFTALVVLSGYHLYKLGHSRKCKEKVA